MMFSNRKLAYDMLNHEDQWNWMHAERGEVDPLIFYNWEQIDYQLTRMGGPFTCTSFDLHSVAS